MRLLFLSLLTSFNLQLYSQLIDLKKEWMSQKPFFNLEFIKKENIKAIHFRVRDKKDGEVMESNSTFLHFLFNENGQILSSFQSQPLSKRVDTSRVLYKYDQRGNCVERSEEKGPFVFSYLFYYNEKNKIIKEYKIDNKRLSKDTLYCRYYETIEGKNQHIVAIKNANKKEFMSISFNYHDNGLLERETTKFSRNQNRIKRSYYYKNDLLTESTYAKNYGSKKFEKWEIVYLGSKPDLIKVFRNGNLIKKIRFNHSDNGRLTALIERDFENESIRLIEITYKYFPN